MKRFLEWMTGRVIYVLLLLFLLSFALIGWLSVTRGTPISAIVTDGSREGPPAPGEPRFATTLELMTDTPLFQSNAVELINNGNETYPRLWRDLHAAQRTITVQMYYSQPGAVADSLSRILREKAQAGVNVLLLFDQFGSGPLLKKEGYVEALQAAGVKVARLRPLHWFTLQKANNRSHVRVVTVDGRVGYTGGFGLADYWLGDGRHDEQWRESNVRFEGPVVAQLQAAFAAGWAEATGDLLTSKGYFPDVSFQPAGSVRAGLLYAQPTTGSTNAERFMAMSIAGARKTLYITNSYFVPDDDFRRFLMEAARRGVDVRVLTAGDKTDVKTTTYAGRARYEELMKEGVRIYEYLPTMLHSKTLVADGLWLTVGSLNFDNRSLAFNNESNLVAQDSALGASMDSVFMADLRYSKELRLDTWEKRSWKEKLLEKGANALSRLL